LLDGVRKNKRWARVGEETAKEKEMAKGGER
jgi:hypothetical protein